MSTTPTRRRTRLVSLLGAGALAAATLAVVTPSAGAAPAASTASDTVSEATFTWGLSGYAQDGIFGPWTFKDPTGDARYLAGDVSTVPNTSPQQVYRVDPVPTTSFPTSKAGKAPNVVQFTGGDGTVDPASLAAFQSFMQPGDIQDEDPLRDGVSALLAQVPCSRLQVSFDPETTTLQVNGHIPEGDLRAPVLAALQAQIGADIGVSDNILILPRPQCGALAGISEVGLPQSTDQITNPLLIGEDTQARVLGFVKDQRLFFDITAPDYPAYVYVDYFDADGNVLHLAPNKQVPLTRAEPESAIRIGAEKAGDPGLQMLVGPPYGQEIAVAFAASSPLYDGLRPLLEPAAPYLAELKDRVVQARASDPGFKGEWVYFFVTTAER